MKVTTTSRGFELVEFEDVNGEKCSLQQSSATGFERGPGQDHLWLGVNETRPKILASKAAAAGIQTTETTGWVEVPLPEGALISSRMHLDRDQARELVTHLKRWIDTGSLRKRRPRAINPIGSEP
jgi:hypothetical protein